MANANTKIEWTDATWSPVTGCTKVSQGCHFCYAERLWPKVEGSRVKREGGAPRAFTDVRCHPERLDAPLHWRTPRRIFVNSMSDLFHDDVPDIFIADVFAYMAYARQHQFQVLTKRPQRMLRLLTSAKFAEHYDSATGIAHDDACDILGKRGEFDPNRRLTTDIRAMDPTPPLPNVWLGVSVEDQATADERIPLLLQTPAAIRFVSYEPALGPVSFKIEWLRCPGGAEYGHGFNRTEVHAGCCENHIKLDWLIAGGESGPNARPAHPDWFRSARDQCAAVGVAYFFKQWGEWISSLDVPSGDADTYSSKTRGSRSPSSVVATQTTKRYAHLSVTAARAALRKIAR